MDRATKERGPCKKQINNRFIILLFDVYNKKMQDHNIYQKSFLTRSTRVWNILPKDLTDKNTTFNGFKSGLLKHYKSALRNVYNAEDPRTWKSICLSCNTSRNLSCPISCCS